MIGIGINEVTIDKASINAKKNLEIIFGEAANLKKPKLNLFEKSLTARTADEGSGQYTMNVFSPKLSDKPDFTAEKKLNMVHADINRLIKQLSQILEQFVTVAEIDLETANVQFNGTGITDNETLMARMLMQTVIDQIYDNITKRFVELMQPHIQVPTEEKTPLRLKLVRNYKNFPELPKRDIKDNPFIELASIPLDQSRVKFTDYEKAEGMDKSTPVTQDAAEKKGAAAASTTTKKVADANPFE